MKSKCYWLISYYEGELSEDKRRLFEEHLHSCSACLRQLEELKQLRTSLPEMMTFTSDSSQENRIYVRFLDKVKRRSTPRTYWRYAYSFVFFVLCLAFALPILLTGPSSIVPNPMDLEKAMVQSFNIPPETPSLATRGALESTQQLEYASIFAFSIPEKALQSFVVEISELDLPFIQENQRVMIGLAEDGENTLLTRIRGLPQVEERDFFGNFRPTTALPAGNSLLILESGEGSVDGVVSLIGAVAKSQFLSLQSHWAIYPLLAALLLLIFRPYWRKRVLDWLFLLLLFSSMLLQVFGPEGYYQSEVSLVKVDSSSLAASEIERNLQTTRFLLNVAPPDESPFHLPLRGREISSQFPQDWWFLQRTEVVPPQFELISLNSNLLTLSLFLLTAGLQVLFFLAPLLLWVLLRRRDHIESELVKIANSLPEVVQGEIRP